MGTTWQAILLKGWESLMALQSVLLAMGGDAVIVKKKKF